MADKSQQTEQATPRRLEKARTEGQFPTARDFVNSLQFLLFVALLGAGGASWFWQCRITTRALIDRAFHGDLTVASITALSWWIASRSLTPLAFLGVALLLVTVAVQLVSTGFGFSLSKLTPDLNRLNPAPKLSGLLKDNVPAVIQALIMLPFFALSVYYVATDRAQEFFTLPLQTLEAGTHLIGASLHDLLYKGAALFVVFGAVNLFRQRRRYTNEMKMSKNEIKDEAKESDGNPQTKQRVRRMQRDMRRRQMMREVPNATAVVVNPTHYAVAIKYSMDSMSAPTVVAKGKNYLALRIRTLAINHQIPIIENPPLARALYKSADVGQEIPAHLYRAVAEILAYIYKLMNGRRPN
jgi:flagellar biosynthesis protein FlhB